MKKHRWFKPGSSRSGKGRRCIDCGIRRSIKPGTKGTWQYRYHAKEGWRENMPCTGPTRATLRRLGVG